MASLRGGNHPDNHRPGCSSQMENEMERCECRPGFRFAGCVDVGGEVMNISIGRSVKVVSGPSPCPLEHPTMASFLPTLSE